jgi:hypothetical protein
MIASDAASPPESQPRPSGADGPRFAKKKFLHDATEHVRDTGHREFVRKALGGYYTNRDLQKARFRDWEHARDAASLAKWSAVNRLDELLPRFVDNFEARATRIDVAADFVGQELALYDHAAESCAKSELCGARRFSPYEERSITEGRVGATLYVGRRGQNGSGRLGRIYDKGLESGQAAAGAWERFEVEFTSDCAAQVAHAITNATEWRRAATAMLLGAFEFRRVTGRRELQYRPLVTWWAKLVALVETRRAAMIRTPSTLTSYAAWIDRAVAPTLKAMAAISGTDYAGLFALLVGVRVE